MSQIDKAFERKIKTLEEGLNRIIVIHYACESFLDVKKGSPTIDSIATKDLPSGQVTTFALCDYESEETMLEAYFRFLHDNRDRLFGHWNMNDTVYGFEAIRNRYLQLTGKQGTMIQSDQLFDLDDLVEKKYGKHYAPHPKLYNLLKTNRYSAVGLRSGKDEAESFKQGAYFENKLQPLERHISSPISLRIFLTIGC